MNKKYEDIINLPHHVSTRHPRMSATARAAQFSPFAALTGHDSAIRETARLTEARRELDESVRDELFSTLYALARTLPEQPKITVTWFCPDTRKRGGSHVATTGVVKRIDEYTQRLIMADGTSIPLSDIVSIDGEMDTFRPEVS